MLRAVEVVEGSDGDGTKAYYAELEKCGPVGIVALNLFRAQKCSTRAKGYRGGIRGKGSYRRMAYDRKSWSIENLCRVLAAHSEALGIRYGWKADPACVFDQDPSWVLYVDLPQGQVSFHSPNRGEGPDYAADWDGKRLSAERIIQFCDSVYARDERQMEIGAC